MPQAPKRLMVHAALWPLLAFAGQSAWAAPTVSRLTPPSELFASGQPEPVIARFLPGQRFDLQATLRADAGARITEAHFEIDGKAVAAPVALRACEQGCQKDIPLNASIATVRAVSVQAAGRHHFSVSALQSDGQRVTAQGNFDVLPFATPSGQKVKNIIILLGDGMGAAQRTAARIVKGRFAQG